MCLVTPQTGVGELQLDPTPRRAVGSQAPVDCGPVSSPPAGLSEQLEMKPYELHPHLPEVSTSAAAGHQQRGGGERSSVMSSGHIRHIS